jgi:hypothetical protein
MLLSTLRAPPLWPRLVVVHPSFGLVVFVVAMLLVLPAARADDLPSLSLEEAIRIASQQSPQMAAQRSAITAAEQAAVSARQLPDPKGFFGIDNLPVTTSEAWSVTQDFMTMRKIGVMQDFPGAGKRELKGKLAERVTAREQAMLVDVQAALWRVRGSIAISPNAWNPWLINRWPKCNCRSTPCERGSRPARPSQQIFWRRSSACRCFWTNVRSSKNRPRAPRPCSRAGSAPLLAGR